MSVKSSHILKQLETRRSALQAECEVKRRTLADADREYQAAIAKIRAVEREIEALKTTSSEPVITEHALLRYLERVHRVDLDSIRREMVTPAVAAQIRSLKSCKLPIADGVCLVVEDHTVRTVETANQQDKTTRKSGRLRPVRFRAQQAEEEGFH